MNKSLVHKPEDMSFNASINSNIAQQVTPVKVGGKIITSSPRRKKLHPVMSLLDEMNDFDQKYEGDGDDEEIFDNEHHEEPEREKEEVMEMSDKTLQDELNETEDTLEEDNSHENEQDLLIGRKTSTTSISSIPNREIKVQKTIKSELLTLVCFFALICQICWRITCAFLYLFQFNSLLSTF